MRLLLAFAAGLAAGVVIGLNLVDTQEPSTR